MGSLCVNWASTFDGIEHTYIIQKATLMVLFGMINSPHWHTYVVMERWNTSPEPQPLGGHINNPELVGVIKNVTNPAAMVPWLEILWLKYRKLIPQVQEGGDSQ